MDKGKYTIKALRTKYDDFRGPAFTAIIDGKSYDSTQYSMTDLEVDISADGSAGGCSFSFKNVYDQSKSKWVEDLLKKIKVGSTLEIQCGYVKKEKVFFGYVDECSVDLSADTAGITVVGMDGLGFLINCCEPIYGGNKKPKQIVEEILRKAVSAGYAKSAKVGTIPAPSVPVPSIKERIDDFSYLKLLSQRYCKSLMCINGELIFDNVMSYSSPIMELTVGSSLFDFRKRLSLRNQVGKVVVWGRDVNQKFIKGQAASVTVPGSGKSATSIAPKFKDTVLREYCEYVRTVKDCTDLAQARLDSIAMGFVSGSGSCVGLPEIIPGRFISITGMDGETDGTYYISHVRHTISEDDGYRTQIEIKGAKA